MSAKKPVDVVQDSREPTESLVVQYNGSKLPSIPSLCPPNTPLFYCFMVKAIPQSSGFFTADQANEMLPLVRRIAADWVELNATVESQQAQLEGLKTLHQTVGVKAYSEEVAEVEQSLQAERDRLVDCYNELESLGLEPHAEEIGSVDFPAILQGREVRLCWRFGESEVRHWHEIGGAVAERQLITLPAERMGG